MPSFGGPRRAASRRFVPAHQPGGALLLAVAAFVSAGLAPSALLGARVAQGRAPSAARTAASRVRCPLQPSATIPGGEAWAFTTTAPPSTSHSTLTSTYVHGRGAWTGGHGSGTICRQDSLPGGGAHDLVLAVAGPAHVSTHITRLGHLGAGLVLAARVAQSDDHSCPVGSRAAVTFFASYYEGHHDSVRFSFSGGACGAYDATYLGPLLHVVIARNGLQVNSA